MKHTHTHTHTQTYRYRLSAGDGRSDSEDEYYDRKEAEIFKKKERKEADSQVATVNVSSKADCSDERKKLAQADPERSSTG